MKKLLPCLFAWIISANALANKFTCPKEDQVKIVKLVRPLQHADDNELWDFYSTTFLHENIEWQVTFGTFLPNATTPDIALKQGQAYFDQAPLINKHPKLVILPHHVLFCDYVPAGREYWISAVSPPQGYKLIL